MANGLMREICGRYDLGQIIGKPEPISGGLLHKMWRIRTTRGSFAVKELNPEVTSRPGARESYLLSEKIARSMAAAGVPAVAALVCHDSPLCETANGTFMVFPWIDGHALTGKAEKGQVRKIGSILGLMLRLDLKINDSAPLALEEAAVTNWEELIAEASALPIGWADEARAMQPQLIRWSSARPRVAAYLKGKTVISHCDTDKKNVLWIDASTPVIIDWECAGPINPGLALLATALDWAGLQEGPVDEELVDAFLEGYMMSGGILADDAEYCVQGLVGVWLDWLSYNMRRSVRIDEFSAEERAIGLVEAAKTLRILENLNENRDLYASRFQVSGDD